MKDDSWSLEGKKVNSTIIKTIRKLSGVEDFLVTPDFKHEKAYLITDIETLRKKLIGDLIELFMVGYNKDKVIKKAFPKLYNQAYDRCIKGVEILVNERFGVNE